MLKVGERVLCVWQKASGPTPVVVRKIGSHVFMASRPRVNGQWIGGVEVFRLADDGVMWVRGDDVNGEAWRALVAAWTLKNS